MCHNVFTQMKAEISSLNLVLKDVRSSYNVHPEHMYLQFLTPLKPSVEKSESQWVKVYKPRNNNILSSQCGS